MKFWKVLFLFAWLGLCESVDYEDALTEEERLDVFGTNSSLNLPKVESVYLTLLSYRPEKVRYRLRWNDREEDLTLTPPEHPLFSPGCIVHHYYKNKMKTISPCNTNNNCYYTGKSDNHTDSWIAAEICGGMKGVIKLDKDVLYIHPDPHSQHSFRSVLHPHIIYRYNSSGQHICGTEADEPVDLNESHRGSRSAQKKFIETRLVIDPEMMNYHIQDDRPMTDYVSVLFTIARTLYEQPSLGDRIILTVSDIIYVESHEEFGSSFTNDAQRVLEKFCEWTPSSSHSKIVPDANVLLTRRNLVYKGNNVNGLSNTGCLCLKKTKCAVVQDIGPYTGYALAHEIGHLLGMHHDGEQNNCTAGIMSKNGASGGQAFTWSRCSRKYLQEYIRSHTDELCLYNDPRNVLLTNSSGLTSSTTSQLLPGYIYTADEQCQLMHDKNASFSYDFPKRADPCRQLVCMAETHVVINTLPLLDGTDINNTRTMCWEGVAVAMDSALYLDPIHGNYSDWEAGWSICSRTCGGGVMLKRRACDNPRPRYGGSPCKGPDTKAVLCNMAACPDNLLHRKCDELNTLYPGSYWFPFIDNDKKSPCSIINCTNGTNFISHDTADPDGTFCGLNITDALSRCVNGKCRRFGCDGHMESGLLFDHCHVCNGNDVGCRLVSGKYGKEEYTAVYTDVITIPAQSTSVVVAEQNKFRSLILVINGTRYIDYHSYNMNGPYTFGGVNIFVTNHDHSYNTPYYLRASGPIPVNVTIQVHNRTENSVAIPNITYSFYVPNNKTSEHFSWTVIYTSCSKSCDTGMWLIIIKCKSATGEEVPDYHCDIYKKPTIFPQPCNSHSCPAEWTASSWSPCSKTCDYGTRVREVYCTYRYNSKDQNTTDTRCPNKSRPADIKTCFVRSCPGVWKTGDYGACSMSCGLGIMKRPVLCFESNTSTSTIDDQYCDDSIKPKATRPCFETFCIYSNSCNDKTTDCSSYGNDDEFCVGDYQELAFKNCAKFCQVCATCGDHDAGFCATFVNERQNFCENSKKWTQMHCRKLCGHCTACALPPVVSNANINGQISYDVGSEVKYECTLGYEFVNESSVSCERYGVWSKAPECKAICGSPPPVANGTIIQEDSRFVGSVVYYACAPGYKFSKDVYSVRCLDNGMWTPAPVCEAVCENKRLDCDMFDTNFCSDPTYTPFWTNFCPKTCDFC